jgi:hypothetical protein
MPGSCRSSMTVGRDRESANAARQRSSVEGHTGVQCLGTGQWLRVAPGVRWQSAVTVSQARATGTPPQSMRTSRGSGAKRGGRGKSQPRSGRAWGRQRSADVPGRASASARAPLVARVVGAVSMTSSEQAQPSGSVPASPINWDCLARLRANACAPAVHAQLNGWPAAQGRILRRSSSAAMPATSSQAAAGSGTGALTTSR